MKRFLLNRRQSCGALFLLRRSLFFKTEALRSEEIARPTVLSELTPGSASFGVPELEMKRFGLE